jgi:hypothetical protein
VSERLQSKQTYYEENGASGRGGYVVEKEAELVRALVPSSDSLARLLRDCDGTVWLG